MVEIKAKCFEANDIKNCLPNVGLDFDVTILIMTLRQNPHQLLRLALDGRVEFPEARS